MKNILVLALMSLNSVTSVAPPVSSITADRIPRRDNGKGQRQEQPRRRLPLRSIALDRADALCR